MTMDASHTTSAPACHGASDSAFPVGSLLLPDGIAWAVLYARTLEIPRHIAAHGRFRFLLSLWCPARMGTGPQPGSGPRSALRSARTHARRPSAHGTRSRSTHLRRNPIMTKLSNTYFEITDLIDHLLTDTSNLTTEKVSELEQIHAEITRLDQAGAPTQYS